MRVIFFRRYHHHHLRHHRLPSTRPRMFVLLAPTSTTIVPPSYTLRMRCILVGYTYRNREGCIITTIPEFGMSVSIDTSDGKVWNGHHDNTRIRKVRIDWYPRSGTVITTIPKFGRSVSINTSDVFPVQISSSPRLHNVLSEHYRYPTFCLSTIIIVDRRFKFVHHPSSLTSRPYSTSFIW